MHGTKYAYLNKLLLLKQLQIATVVYVPHTRSMGVFLTDVQRCKALLCTNPEPYICSVCRLLLRDKRAIFVSPYALKELQLTWQEVSSDLLTSRD